MGRSYTESLSDFNAADGSAFVALTVGFTKVQEMAFRQVKLGIVESSDVIFPPKNGFYTSKMQHELWPAIRGWFPEDFAVFWEQRYGLLD